MARPVVLVYQEYAQTSATPQMPDLNCLLVGPCYWIKDYLDDKGAQADGGIQVSSDYGVKNASYPNDVPPAAHTDAITIVEPPSNQPGALLDPDSVAIFFDACRVLITADEGTGVTVGGTLPNNKITVPGGSPLVLTDIKAGDYVIIQDPAGPGILPGHPDLVKRVQSVDTTLGVIYLTTNFTAAHDTLKMRVEREVYDVLLDDLFVVVSGNTVKVQGGATTVLTGESTARVINYAQVYMQYRSLRQDLRLLDTVSSETEVTTKLGKIDARNPLAGCAITALANTITPIQFFGVMSDDLDGHLDCLDIISGHRDVYATVPLTVEQGILAVYKTKYDGLADPGIAESTGIPQKFRVVLGSHPLPTEKVISPANIPTGVAGQYLVDALHASVDGAYPGTNGAITTADDVNIFVDPAGQFLTNGVRAGDTLVVVADASTGHHRLGTYTVAQVYDNQRLRINEVFTPTGTDLHGGITGLAAYYIIRGSGTPVASTTFTGGDVAATGGLVTMPSVTGLSAHVGKVLRITASGAPANVGDWLVGALNAAGPPAVLALIDTTPGTLADDTAGTAGALFAPVYSVVPADAHTVTTRRCFRVLKSATATFQDDLVIAGDSLEINNPVQGVPGVLPPHDPVFTFATMYRHPIAYIPNENDVILAMYEDAEAYNPAAGDTDLHCRVDRTMTKDAQVTELVSVAQSFKSRRTILVWPDSVVVTDLVDGSKPRVVATTKAAADPQPGYYLAAVVGGMTAGLPSHQGFTNLGIAGIDQIYHSTRYFSDTQITTLSDGGWFLFMQDTPAALPYCLHQLTTDPSTLETGEYSVVKNFDFISMFFMDLMYGFLGQYNVTDETIGLLEQSLVSGIDLLKLRKYAKIGAPVISATIASIAVSSAAEDRINAVINVQMPKPLNRVGLYLVSV